jgi:hypothetical protein
MSQIFYGTLSKRDDDKRIVEGYATSEAIDASGEIIRMIGRHDLDMRRRTGDGARRGRRTVIGVFPTDRAAMAAIIDAAKVAPLADAAYGQLQARDDRRLALQ